MIPPKECVCPKGHCWKMGNDNSNNICRRELKVDKGHAVLSNSTDGLYRKLGEGEEIKEGDQFFNPDWEVGGPWYDIDTVGKGIGLEWQPSFRPVRRAV